MLSPSLARLFYLADAVDLRPTVDELLDWDEPSKVDTPSIVMLARATAGAKADP